VGERRLSISPRNKFLGAAVFQAHRAAGLTRYQGHQYREWLLKNVATILDADLAIGSAGILKGGAVAWVQIEMEETVKTEVGLDFRPFLLASTSFDGSVATQYGRKIQAVVCDNTLEMANNEQGQLFKARHTKYSGMKISAARDALNIVHAMAEDFEKELKSLTETAVTEAEWSKFIEAYVPIDPDSTRTNNRATE